MSRPRVRSLFVIVLIAVVIVAVLYVKQASSQTPKEQCVVEARMLDDRKAWLLREKTLLEQRYVGVTDQRLIRDIDNQGDRLVVAAKDWLRDLESFKARCLRR